MKLLKFKFIFMKDFSLWLIHIKTPTLLVMILFLSPNALSDNTKSDEENIKIILNSFCQLILKNNSTDTMPLVVKDDIQYQFNSIENYHRYMSSFFRKLKNDGGVDSIEQGNVWFSNSRYYSEVVIKTKRSLYKGVFEFKNTEGHWLISNIP